MEARPAGEMVRVLPWETPFTEAEIVAVVKLLTPTVATVNVVELVPAGTETV